MEKRFYSVKEFGEITGVSRAKSYELLRKNLVPFVKIGEQYFIPVKEFEEWIEKNMNRV